MESSTQLQQTEECVELKNIMYKSMLLNGVPIKEKSTSNDLSNIEKYLEEEKNNNKNDPWSKLDKTIKMKKMIEYVEQYKTEKHLSEEEVQSLVVFLRDCLDRKKLFRVKDVIYDKTKGTIKEIPALQYNRPTKHFSLKNVDKRVSTLKSLPTAKPTTKAKPSTAKPTTIARQKTEKVDTESNKTDQIKQIK